MCLWLQTWWYFCWGLVNLEPICFTIFELLEMFKSILLLLYCYTDIRINYNIITVVLNSSLRWWSVHSRNMSVWKLGDPAVTLRPWQNHRTYIAIECCQAAANHSGDVIRWRPSGKHGRKNHLQCSGQCQSAALFWSRFVEVLKLLLMDEIPHYLGRICSILSNLGKFDVFF